MVSLRVNCVSRAEPDDGKIRVEFNRRPSDTEMQVLRNLLMVLVGVLDLWEGDFDDASARGLAKMIKEFGIEHPLVKTRLAELAPAGVGVVFRG